MDRRSIVLWAVDVVAIAILVVVGLNQHGVDLLDESIYAASVVLPFVIGWVAIAPLAGVYRPEVRLQLVPTIRLTALAWVAAANVGLILRSSPVFDGGTAWPFNLVMTGLGLVVLVGWRVAYVRWVGSP